MGEIAVLDPGYGILGDASEEASLNERVAYLEDQIMELSATIAALMDSDRTAELSASITRTNQAALLALYSLEELAAFGEIPREILDLAASYIQEHSIHARIVSKREARKTLVKALGEAVIGPEAKGEMAELEAGRKEETKKQKRLITDIKEFFAKHR